MVASFEFETELFSFGNGLAKGNSSWLASYELRSFGLVMISKTSLDLTRLVVEFGYSDSVCSSFVGDMLVTFLRS